MTLPNVRGISEAIRHILTPVGMKVSFWSNVTLQQLPVRPKDHIPESEATVAVSCASCPATCISGADRQAP